MTTTEPGTRYLDGWADACHELRAQLARGDVHCPTCAIDRVHFAGIAAAALRDADLITPDEVRGDIANHTARMLVATVLNPDPLTQASVIAQAKHVVDTQPNVAVGIITRLAIAVGRQHDVDGVLTREWGQ